MSLTAVVNVVCKGAYNYYSALRFAMLGDRLIRGGVPPAAAPYMNVNRELKKASLSTTLSIFCEAC